MLLPANADRQDGAVRPRNGGAVARRIREYSGNRAQAIPAALSRAQRSAASAVRAGRFRPGCRTCEPKLVEIQGFPSLYCLSAGDGASAIARRTASTRAPDSAGRLDSDEYRVVAARGRSSATTIPRTSSCWRSIRRTRRRAAISCSRSKLFGVRDGGYRGASASEGNRLFYERDGRRSDAAHLQPRHRRRAGAQADPACRSIFATTSTSSGPGTPTGSSA